jgi:predicted XRE-type DNA-binding protein
MGSITVDNIFDVVTDNKAEASELQTRSDLMIVLRDIINDSEWQQKETAKQLGLTQPRVSDLINGKIEKFSIDLLMTCLYRIGFRFKPQYKNKKLKMAVESVNN